MYKRLISYQPISYTEIKYSSKTANYPQNRQLEKNV